MHVFCGVIIILQLLVTQMDTLAWVLSAPKKWQLQFAVQLFWPSYQWCL
jgi:hypothetical protein